MSDSKYFQTTKKGEIRELQDDLNSTNKDKRKEAVKKIIAAMTVGKDVSMLFTDVIKSMGTDNIELKKLIYLYIINYARSQPEKAILVVSMFCKDATNHPNPLVRALALRTMGCIRVDRITEYLCDPLSHALKDNDPYVRKTAAICVAKFYDMDPELVTARGFIDLLRNLLSDTNPMVVSNAVASLTEICESSGIDYFKINNKILSRLLIALNESTEWGRVFILEALSKFEAKNKQANDICDRVIPQLSHSNSAVVMSAVKVIIKFMEYNNNKNQEKYCTKLCGPLLSLISSPPEIQYVALRNIDLIIQKYPNIFENDMRIFYVKYNDETYIKKQKLEILIKLATVKNVNVILKEFEQYAQEIDIDFVKRALNGIGRIAIKLDIIAEKCINILSKLIKTKVNYIVEESIIVIKNIFRRYPNKYQKIIVTLCDNLSELTNSKSKASLIWIIGEYSEKIIDANERLKYFVDTFDSESEDVKLQLLTAIVKLFLKKPSKSKQLVQKVLNLCTESSNNPDLRDRAYVYWRLLSNDPQAARKVVLAERPIITSKSINNLSNDYLKTLLNNLSSLSSVYHSTPNEFIYDNNQISFMPVDSDYSDTDTDTDTDTDNNNDTDTDDNEEVKQNPPKSDIKPVKELVPNFGDGITSKNSPKSDIKTDNELPDIIGAIPFYEGKNNDPIANKSPSKSEIPIFNDETLDLHMVFDVNKGDGLEMSMGFKNKNNIPIMIVKCTNKQVNIINRIDIKFNKNYLGIQPIQTVPLNGNITYNQTQIIDVPLKLIQEPLIKEPLDLNVQIAVRIVWLNKPSKVVMFASIIPSQIFFDCYHKLMDKNKFLSEWKSVSVTNDIKKIFDKQLDINIENIKQIYKNNSFVCIGDRNIPNRGVSLYFITLLKNITILMELSIANNRKCRIITKSKDKYLSNIVCNVGVSLIQKQ